jgi:hypothetical protein
MKPKHVLPKSEVGELRPSQMLTTFGVGSLVDLPNLSVLILGLDDWPVQHSTEIGEPRLLRSVQQALGPQVTRLLTPPRTEESSAQGTKWFDEARQIGVPVVPFPRWMVCSQCRLLAPVGSGLFEPKVQPYRPDRARYVHGCTTKGPAPTVLPARFVIACEKGHLDDFPWLSFVHRKAEGCNGPLELYELGASGEAADIEVKCRACTKKRRMAEAFGPDNRKNLPSCSGRHPHLREKKAGCAADVRAMPQGATDSWFSLPVSVLSVPQATDTLARLVDEEWVTLEKAATKEILGAFRAIGQIKSLAKFSDDEIWRVIEKRRQAVVPDDAEPKDLKIPEWRLFSNPDSAPKDARDLKLREVDPPTAFAGLIEQVVIADTLREVRALIGFTRIFSPRDFDSPLDLPEGHRAPLARKPPTWVPAAETLGEGIFLKFSKKAIDSWMDTPEVDRRLTNLRTAYRAWRKKHNLDPETGFPEKGYILLHSLSHAFIRELSLECGYTTASISERIYCGPTPDGDVMSGVLIYTAAPDSEGTLGGLAALGESRKLEGLLLQALERARYCSSDPLCAEHSPTTDDSLHAAACHACLFLPETSCERGNKFLDRAVLVETVEESETAFFPK